MSLDGLGFVGLQRMSLKDFIIAQTQIQILMIEKKAHLWWAAKDERYFDEWNASVDT